ncbi:MAG: ABC transporter substrate-binding protein [Candidatus Tectomicrobia bacterium]|nr:ABC transporter substrate-binding protein [Candidatus Tectomicrobia bacterium]
MTRTARTTKTAALCFSLLLIAMLLVSSLLGAEAGAQAPVKIKIGYGELPTDPTPLLFEKKDILKNYGKTYTVELVQFRGGSAPIPALAAKELDLSYMSFPALASALLRAKLDLKVVSGLAGYAPGYGSPYWVVLEDSSIKKVEDLRGKVLGTNALGTGIDFAARAMLLKSGLHYPKDYSFVEVTFPNQEAMLREKKIDMAVLIPAFFYRAKAKGGLRVLFSSLDAIGPSQMLVHVARTEFLQKNSAAVKEFYADYKTALKWFRDPANLDEALDITARFTKRPKQSLKPYAFQKADFYQNTEAVPDVKALQKDLDLLKTLGFIDQKIEIEKYLDLSFIR